MTKTTEREFRQLLLEKADVDLPSGYADAAVEAAREAFGEFAPEPVRLPATFALKREPNPGGLRLVDTGVGSTLGWEAAKEVCRRAMLYPGLREAAEESLEASDRGRGDLEEVWREKLRAELAKGPQ